jgi:autotransporter-associated beta strand protein
MSIRNTTPAIVMLGCMAFLTARQSSAVDYTWNVLGGGTQAWNNSANWNPNTGTPSTSSDTAILQGALASSLSLDLADGVGATGTTTAAAIWFGGSSGAVTTDITGTSALVLNNATANASVISGGVAGSVNRVSAPMILGKNTDISGTSTRDFAISGNLGQVGGAFTLSNLMTGGQTLTIGSGAASRIQLYDTLTPATGRTLNIQNFSASSGTTQTTVINAIWDPGASGGAITLGNANQNPLASYVIQQSQTSSASVTINRQRYVVQADNAFGTGSLTISNNNSQNWGAQIQSDNDARTIGNSLFRLSNPIAFTGSNSATITGTLTQSSNRVLGNNLMTGKQLNLNGIVALDLTTNARTLVIEGSGKTVINGQMINNVTGDNVQGILQKNGTGRVELKNATNTVSGTFRSVGGLLVFGTAGSYGTAVIQTGSAGGVSYAPGTADAGWATFASKLTGSGTNYGFLALPAADAAASLNFSGTASGQLGNAPNLSVVGDGDMTYTGVVTPGSAGYNWGGLSGVLTLPANASTGANTVKYTNGGTVVVAASQTYSGATTVQGVLMTTSQNGITSGTGSSTVAATIAFPSTLSVASVADAGSASSLGSSSNAAANLVIDRATLRHTGASNSSTDRLFTIGVNGATLESAGAGAVTYGSGGGSNALAGTGGRALTLGGASTAANTISSILTNGTGGSDLLSLVKADAGTWVLGGANTYTGTTAVLAGTLLVNGNQSAATGAVSVATSAVLGGSGTMGGNVAFGSGALFAFNAAAPLTVSGSVTFASAATFGVGSLTGLTSSVADAIYPLIAGNVNLTGLANFGSGNAYDLGAGKTAYFEALSPSGLSLVVVPEPTSLAAVAAGAGIVAMVLRRRSRR